MAFYRQFMDVKAQLELLGHEVIAPELEFESEGEDTSVGGFFDRHGGVDSFPPDHEVWKKKGRAIRAHFKKIEESDCILVTNYEKRGIPNYIGGNTFLEVGYAYGLNKKIFILNALPSTSPFKEELLGMQPIVLNGKIEDIQ